MTAFIGRREFITLVGGAAAAWPLAVRAQQGDQIRRIGVLTVFSQDDPEGQRRVAALLQRLQQLGWTDGRNVAIELRWASGDPDRSRFYAGELVGMKPDVIFVNNTLVMPLLQRATRTIPIVFAQIADPVAEGFVASLAQPGSNITGFTTGEYAVGGKKLEVLRKLSVMSLTSRFFWTRYSPLKSASPTPSRLPRRPYKCGVTVAGVRNGAEIERAIAAAAGEPNGGLIVRQAELPTRIAARSLNSRRSVDCPRFTTSAISSQRAGWPHMGTIPPTNTGKRRCISIASSGVPSPLICRCSSRPSSSW